MGKSDFQLSYGASLAFYSFAIIVIAAVTVDDKDGLDRGNAILGGTLFMALVITLLAMNERQFNDVDKPNAYDKLAVSLNFICSVVLLLLSFFAEKISENENGLVFKILSVIFFFVNLWSVLNISSIKFND